MRLGADRFVPLDLGDDEVLFCAGDLFVGVFRAEPFLVVVDLAGDFLALPFRAEVLLRADVLAGDFLAEVFLAEDVLAGDFLAEVFLAEDVLAGDFLRDDGLLDDFFLRSRASAAPPYASAAAPVAANTGTAFSPTTPAAFFPTFFVPEAIFFGPEPTADAASPAFCFTFDIADGPAGSVLLLGGERSRRKGVRPAAFAACSLIVWETSSALPCAISCTLSAIAPTTICPVSLDSAFLPARVTDSVSFL